MGILNSIFGDGIDTNSVLGVLEELEISPNQLKSEKSVENLITRELANEFGANNVHQQYSIPGYFGMKVDIDIGDGKVGIELKLAGSLDNSVANVQRLFGQAIYYYERQYQDNLIVAVVGNEKLRDKPFMQEIERLLEDINVGFIYITTQRRK
ncbi:hypothetical protein [Ekhidna sp.]|uniref:hypothetical protein n=1 Tax=Ekhidna sp. TaxID=2608089 RepID=UPI003B50AC73